MKILFSRYFVKPEVAKRMEAFFPPRVASKLASQHPSGIGLTTPHLHRLLAAGATEEQAERFMTAIELAKRFYMPILAHDSMSLGPYPYISATGLDSFRRIVDPVMHRIGTEQVEHMVVVALNGSLQPIGAEAIAIGTEGMVSSSLRQIERYLRQVNAKAFMILHNHPSQDSSPSEEDIKLTYKLYDYSMSSGIPLVDHVVVTGKQALSIRAKTSIQSDGHAIPIAHYYQVPFYRDDLFTLSVPWIEGPQRNDIGIRFGKGKGDPFFDAQVFLAAPGVAPRKVPAQAIVASIGSEEADMRIDEYIRHYQPPNGLASPTAMLQLWVAKSLLVNACKTGTATDEIKSPQKLATLCPLLAHAKVDVAFVGVNSRFIPVVVVGGDLASKIDLAMNDAHEDDIRALKRLLRSEFQCLEDYGGRYVFMLTRLSQKFLTTSRSRWPSSWQSHGGKSDLADKLAKTFASSDMELLDILDCGSR